MHLASLLVAAVWTSTLVACKEKGEPPQKVSASVPAAAASANTPAPNSPRGDRGSVTEAKAMLDKAVAHYQAAGAKTALADFTGRKAPFFDRDLYVFCMSKDHVESANGGFPQYVGVSTDRIKDADGRPLGKALADAVPNAGTEAAVKYRWLNPVSREVEPKTGFVRNLGDDICGVGAYTP